ncbi:MAG TPA: ABC transporter substrate-binding protein [Conexibacter sp.]|jgi:NitT/TauT family transport system substrate-binding protein
MRWLIAPAAILGLVVAGCGSSSDDGGSPAATASNDTSTVASTTTAGDSSAPQCNDDKIRFQLSFFPNAQHTGYLVAQNRDFYKDAGVDVRTIPGGPTVNPSLQVAQGNVDVAQMDFSEAINAKANGADIVWVAQTYQQDPLEYVSLTRDFPMSDPRALKGAIVGTQQVGELDPELLGMLKQAGLTRDDVTMRSIDPSVDTLLQHRVDVFPLQVFFHISQLEEAGIRYPEDVDILDPNRLGVAVAAQGIGVNRSFYESHRDAVACFLAAAVRGWETAARDPRGAARDVDALQQKGLASPEANAVNVEQTLRIVDTSVDGREVEPLTLDMDYLQQSEDRMLDAGVIRERVDLSDVVDPEPLDRARAMLQADGGQ